MEWISVKDRLPESRQKRFMCNSKSEGIVIASCRRSLGFIEIIVVDNLSVEMRHTDITHWMPLPDPPLETPVDT